MTQQELLRKFEKIGMTGRVIPKVDITELDKQAMVGKGMVQIKEADWWLSWGYDACATFMHRHGVYVLPTLELCEFLKRAIFGGPTIEIGAGNGAIARWLGVPGTDSRIQETPAVMAHNAMLGQPNVEYAEDIVKMEAVEAIRRYNASTVIGCFITQKWDDKLQRGNDNGPDTMEIVRLAQRYIMVGNLNVHIHDPIMALPHEEYVFPWLITRARDQAANRIFVWSKPGLPNIK